MFDIYTDNAKGPENKSQIKGSYNGIEFAYIDINECIERFYFVEM
jgi:hypothetical protein